MNVLSSQWKEKDNFYLVGRTLDLQPDSSWRISESKYSTILQRRFHKNIDYIDTIDLVINKEVDESSLKAIQSNFRISNKGSSGLSLSRLFALLSQSFRVSPKYLQPLPSTPFYEYSHIVSGDPYEKNTYEQIWRAKRCC